MLMASELLEALLWDYVPEAIENLSKNKKRVFVTGVLALGLAYSAYTFTSQYNFNNTATKEGNLTDTIHYVPNSNLNDNSNTLSTNTSLKN